MAWKLEVASNAAATSWTDRTSIVERVSWEVGGEAHLGSVHHSGFDLADDSAAVALPARRVIRMTEDATTPDTVLYRGRISSKDLARGTRYTGNATQYAVDCEDYNSDLYGIRVHDWKRPAETDVQRVQALCAAFLAGSSSTSANARDSTDLDASTYVPNTNTVSLPAKRYDASNPFDVLSDCAKTAGKEFFVTVDGELFYDLPTSTAYAASLSITDSSPNYTSSFPPIDPRGTQDGSEFLSGGAMGYGTGTSVVTSSDSTAESDHDKWEDTLYDDAPTSSVATSRLSAQLTERKVEEDRYSCAIKLAADQVDLVKWGQTLSFRSAAAGVTSPITLRVATLAWKEITPGYYNAEMELAFPEKLRARHPAGSPPPDPVYQPETIAMTYTGLRLKFDPVHFTANAPGDPTKHVSFVFSATDSFSGTPLWINSGASPYTDAGTFAADSTAGDGTGLQIRSSNAITIGDGTTGVDLDTNTPYYLWAKYTDAGGGTGFTDGQTPVDWQAATGSWTGPPAGLSIVVTHAAVNSGGSNSTMRLVTFTLSDGTTQIPPKPGQIVSWEAPQESTNGSRTTFTISSADAYVPGSLEVTVDGVPVVLGLTETSPSAGTFTLDFAPLSDETLRVKYIAA